MEAPPFPAVETLNLSRQYGAIMALNSLNLTIQRGDLIGGELLVFGRHPQILVGVTDRLDQKALFKVSGFYGGAAIASFKQTFARIQEQAALDFDALMAVARVAIVHQERADFALEKLGARGVFCHGSGQASQREKR